MNSAKQVRDFAIMQHPRWTEAELNAYMEGYFTSMLDVSARNEELKREEINAKAKYAKEHRTM